MCSLEVHRSPILSLPRRQQGQGHAGKNPLIAQAWAWLPFAPASGSVLWQELEPSVLKGAVRAWTVGARPGFMRDGTRPGERPSQEPRPRRLHSQRPGSHLAAQAAAPL